MPTTSLSGILTLTPYPKACHALVVPGWGDLGRISRRVYLGARDCGSGRHGQADEQNSYAPTCPAPVDWSILSKLG
jgi:hypothetical protein